MHLVGYLHRCAVYIFMFVVVATSQTQFGLNSFMLVLISWLGMRLGNVLDKALREKSCYLQQNSTPSQKRRYKNSRGTNIAECWYVLWDYLMCRFTVSGN